MENLFMFAFIIIGILFSFGVYQLIFMFSKAPSAKTTKTIKAVLQRQRERINKGYGYLESAAQFIARFIQINEFKRAKLVADLKSAEIAETPEVFQAKAIIQLLIWSFVAVIFLLIFPLVSPPIFALAALMYLKSKQRISENIKEKRREVELDLPRFVNTIVYELSATHDPLVIMEKHIESYSVTFGKELSITVADMRTGNYEAALTRLEARVGSADLSEVVRGLIEMVKGNDTHIYWETLSFKFSEMQKQELRKTAQKVPARIKRLSGFLLFTIIAIYMVVLGTAMYEGIKTLF
ncbi:MAG: hypothetical protein FWH08_00395 [Oscillospiraceae bacterium]|nr:hypothetical protein [Oscillospiraceae bacterium]